MKSLEQDAWAELKSKLPPPPVTYQVIDPGGPSDQRVVYNGPDVLIAVDKAKSQHRWFNRLIMFYCNGRLCLQWEPVDKKRPWWKEVIT